MTHSEKQTVVSWGVGSVHGWFGLWLTEFPRQGAYGYTYSRENLEADIHAHAYGNQHDATHSDSDSDGHALPHRYALPDKHACTSHRYT
jgi:hypothetical protein